MTKARATRKPYASRLPPEERREQLLAAAQTIALDRGFHAVTIDGVAKACGVTRPVVYGTFADRTALLNAMVDRAERRVLGELATVFPAVPGPGDELDPDELLVVGLTAYLTSIASDPPTWRVILLPPEGAPPEMVGRVDAQRQVVLEHLTGLLEWGLERRGGPALDVELFARAVVALAEGAGRLVLEDPERWTVPAFAAFARTTLSALRPNR